MSQDWDSYLCLIDDEPASILVDLGVVAEAPLSGYPVLGILSVALRNPGPEGLSTQEEFDDLSAIDDAIDDFAEGADWGVYVGRSTSAGTREFYFYIADADGWAGRIGSVMAAFPEYPFQADAREDTDWSAYFEVLYPSPLDMQRIQNARVCRALEENGDAMETEREVSHWIYLPSEEARAEFIEEAAKLGFAAEPPLDEDEPGDEEPRYGVQVVRMDVPSYDEIDAITLPLFELANELGGEYDGWETKLIKE